VYSPSNALEFMSLRGPYDIGEPQSLIITVIPFLKTTANLWFP